MKPFLTAAALLATLLAGACSEKTENPTPTAPAAADSFIKAAPAGSPAFAATGDVAAVNGTRVSSTDPADAPARLVLRGTMPGNGHNITLTLVKFTGVGTYPVKADPDATLSTSLASYSENGLTGPFYYSQFMTPPGTTVGQVVVTSYDAAAKRIQGTFSFTGTTRASGGTPAVTKQVTDGTFDIRDVALF